MAQPNIVTAGACLGSLWSMPAAPSQKVLIRLEYRWPVLAKYESADNSLNWKDENATQFV